MLWSYHTSIFQRCCRWMKLLVRKYRYFVEICLVYERDFIAPSFGQSHQHSVLFLWVPNVNSFSVFIISKAGDSLNQGARAPVSTYPGLSLELHAASEKHKLHSGILEPKNPTLQSSSLFIFIPKINWLMKLNQLSSCRKCITSCTEQIKVSTSIFVSLTCQERVFSAGQRLSHVIKEDQKVSRGAAESYQSQMETCLPSLCHMDVRNYLSSL